MINWHDYFVYDTESPSGLRWKVTRYKGKSYKQIAVMAGTWAGSLHTDASQARYWKVKLNSKQYGVHFVIFEMHSGKVEEGNLVDHIDGDTLNNSPSNLRQVSPKLSCRNRCFSNSSTGFIGVTKEGGRYRAVWYNATGTRESRSFSIKLYGESLALELAKECRQAAIIELNNSGEGYSERHGGING